MIARAMHVCICAKRRAAHDTMWFEDSSGSILAAGGFRDDGKGIKEQVDGVKKAPVEPKFQARIDAGTGDVEKIQQITHFFIMNNWGCSNTLILCKIIEVAI